MTRVLDNLPVILIGLLVVGLVALGLLEAPSWFWHPLGYCSGGTVAVRDCKGYNSWSGSFSDIGLAAIPVSITLTAIGAWRHLNCEHPGCWRTGHRHPDHGRPVCRDHYDSPEADPRTTTEATDAE